MSSKVPIKRTIQVVEEDSSQQNQIQNINTTNPLHLLNTIEPFKQNLKQGRPEEQSSDIDSDDYVRTFQQFNQNQHSANSQQNAQALQRVRRYPKKYPFKRNHQANSNEEELKRIMNFKKDTVKDFVNSSLKQKQIEISINGIATYFPYEPYPLQLTYMQKVIQALRSGQNALLESPTGTGKTLCLLASALSWAYSQKQHGRHRKIIYLSRTHSQLSQTQRQLKKTCFRPTMSHVGSRDHFCSKPQLQQLRGRQKMEACSKGVNLRKKDWKGQIKWNKMQMNEVQQTYKAMCTYYKQKNETVSIGINHFSNKVLEMQDFLQQGQNHKFCPYYYPYHMDQYCDLFMMPYNYILDIDLLPRFSKMIENGVLIFDEAHNVAQASCEGRSYQFLQYNLKGAEGELIKLLQSPNVSQELKDIRKKHRKDIEEIIKHFQDFRQTIVEFINRIQMQKCPNMSQKLYLGQQNQIIKVFGSQDMYLALYELFKGVIFDEGVRQVFNTKGDYFKKSISTMTSQISHNCTRIDSLIQQLKQTSDGIFHNMEKVSTFCKKTAALISDSIISKQNFIQKEINHFRLVVKVRLDTRQRNEEGRVKIKDFTIELRCLVPWLTFQNILQLSPRSIIFTSGTMSPLQSWQSQLKIQAPVKLVNSHVISQRQVCLNILNKNIKGNPFDFRYKTILSNTHNAYTQLIETIFQISRKVPNGMIVICPNFKTLSQMKYHVGKQPYRDKLNKVKRQIFEQRGSEKYIEQFKHYSADGAILYCVCRGRASEGIDFPDHNCRAVVFVGVPFPNINDPIIIERKQHFEKLHKFKKIQRLQNVKCGINWEKWYFNGTIRAINQGLGRLIRHAKDYGMLFLLDQRYGETRFQDAMPKWTQNSISIWQQFTNDKIQKIEQFYTQNAQKYPSAIDRGERKQSKPLKQANKVQRQIVKLQIKREDKSGDKVVNKKLQLSYYILKKSFSKQ